MTFIVKKKEQVPHAFEEFVNNFLHSTLKDEKEIIQKNSRAFDPRVNILERENAFELQFALPGWTKSDIEIQLDQEELIIKGEKDTKVNKDTTIHTLEFDYGKFEKRFDLPEEKFGEVNAEMKDGILTVLVEKKVKKETNKRIAVR